jgi:uroporphyrinogen-III synthase
MKPPSPQSSTASGRGDERERRSSIPAGAGANESPRESDTKPLAGLSIVVTRPREQAAALAQRIEQLGGKPLLFPLLEIAPAGDARALRELAQHLAAYDLLVFISPNAVRYGLAEIGAHAIPARLQVAAVGQGSAQALRAAGIERVIVPPDRYDSEALLAAPELRDVSGRRVAILRGDGGRELLGDTLRARGATVDYVTCYQRSKPRFDAASLLAAAPDAFTVTSSEALGYLWEMLAEPARARLATTTLFVPHARIAELARQQGWQHVVVTASGDDGMTAALVAWTHTERN